MLKLSILTPGRIFFANDPKEEPIQSILVPSADGQLGILKGHCPLVTSFSTGLLSIRAQDEPFEHFALIDGFVKIQNDIVTVLCRFAQNAMTLEESLDILEKTRDDLEAEYSASNNNVQVLKNYQKSAILVKLKKIALKK